MPNKLSPRSLMAISSPQELFRFFDLPPELRNRVYDCLNKQVQVRDQDFYLQKPNHLCIVSNAPIISVLLANRQLSHKYEKQRKRSASSAPVTLTVVSPQSPMNFDPTYASGAQWPQNLPEECARSIGHLVIYGHAQYLELYPPGERPAQRTDPQTLRNVRYEFDSLSQKLKGAFTQQLRNLEAIDIKLFTWKPTTGWPESQTDKEVEEYFGQFEGEKPWDHPLVRSCEVSLLDREEDHELWCRGEKELEVFATWTRREGWKAGRRGD